MNYSKQFRERILQLIRDKDHELKSLSVKELCRIASAIIPKQSKLEIEGNKPIDIQVHHNYTHSIDNNTEYIDQVNNRGTGGTGMPELGGGTSNESHHVPKNREIPTQNPSEEVIDASNKVK